MKRTVRELGKGEQKNKEMENCSRPRKRRNKNEDERTVGEEQRRGEKE